MWEVRVIVRQKFPDMCNVGVMAAREVAAGGARRGALEDGSKVRSRLTDYTLSPLPWTLGHHQVSSQGCGNV